MAWIARVLDIKHGSTELTSVVEVGFYDDADARNSPLPRIFLDKKFYGAEYLESIPAFIALLDSDGTASRTAYDRVQAIQASLPIGSERAIPV